jgi:hypothetical protein
MGNCKDCIWWDKYEYIPRGECAAMKADKRANPVHRESLAHSEDAKGTVMTAPDFGCVMFKAKEGGD